jgi:hypothetical protein
MAEAQVATSNTMRPRFLAMGAWWVAQRHALPIAVYRFLVGLLLVFHFARYWQDMPAVIGKNGVYLPVIGNARDVADGVFLWLDQSLGWARVCAGSGVALSVGISLGLGPRLCGVLLFLLSTWMYRVGFHVSSLDDYLVCFVLFWLCLLPCGRTFGAGRHDRWRFSSGKRVEGWTTSLFILHMLLIHANVAMWRSFSPAWRAGDATPAMLCGISACLLTPSRGLRALGIAGMLVLHAGLVSKTGLTFAHGAFAASVVLVWGDGGRIGTAQPASTPIGTKAALGAVFIALSVATAVGERIHPRPWSAAASSVLWDAGLLATASGRKLQSPRRTAVEPDAAEAHRIDLISEPSSTNPRMQLLLSYLERPQDDPPLVERIASGLVSRRCSQGAPSGETGKLWFIAEETAMAVAWYECPTQGAPRLVLLDDT